METKKSRRNDDDGEVENLKKKTKNVKFFNRLVSVIHGEISSLCFRVCAATKERNKPDALFLFYSFLCFVRASAQIGVETYANDHETKKSKREKTIKNLTFGNSRLRRITSPSFSI